MDFLIQFIMPLFGVLTAVLIATSIIQMKSSKQHEKSAADRHATISNSQNQLIKEVEKVHKKIDTEVIPTLSDAFKKKSNNTFGLNVEDIEAALKDIGYDNHFVSESGEFFLVGLEDNDKTEYLSDYFKVYYFIHSNLESKDLLIESHSYEFNEFNEEIAMLVLSLNDSFKVSGFSLENFDGRYVLKSQYLIDAPDNSFNSKTLEFILEAMFRAHQEIIMHLNTHGVKVAYIQPHELISLQNDIDIPNKAIKSDA